MTPVSKIHTYCQLRKFIKENNTYIRWSSGFDLDKEMKYSKNHYTNKIYPGICAIEISEYLDLKQMIFLFLKYFHIKSNLNTINCHIYDGKFLEFDESLFGSVITDIKYKATLSNKLIDTLLKIYLNKFYNKKHLLVLKYKDVCWYEKIVRKYKRKNIKIKCLPCIKGDKYKIKGIE